jgi:hypothetical protein
MLLYRKSSRPCSRRSTLLGLSVRRQSPPSTTRSFRRRGCSRQNPSSLKDLSESIHPQHRTRRLRPWTDHWCICASAEAGGEGTDATAADGSWWLKPRDVRNDSAGRRPSPKAVGCRGGPDNLCLATDAFCSCDNSENNRTRRNVSASH